jgi:hypothetical protein
MVKIHHASYSQIMAQSAALRLMHLNDVVDLNLFAGSRDEDAFPFQPFVRL